LCYRNISNCAIINGKPKVQLHLKNNDLLIEENPKESIARENSTNDTSSNRNALNTDILKDNNIMENNNDDNNTSNDNDNVKEPKQPKFPEDLGGLNDDVS
jgi:hypothetical protein